MIIKFAIDAIINSVQQIRSTWLKVVGVGSITREGWGVGVGWGRGCETVEILNSTNSLY